MHSICFTVIVCTAIVSFAAIIIVAAVVDYKTDKLKLQYNSLINESSTNSKESHHDKKS